jgi:putative transposase
MRRSPAVPHQNTVFRQVTKFIPWGTLDRLVVETGADKGVTQLYTKGQLLTMIFAQLAGARGLRDIEALLESHAARRRHAGLPRGRRSTLADANRKRPAGVFRGLFSAMVASLDRRLRRQIGESVYLIDSTLIKLNELSEWSRVSAHMLGVKAHILYD